MKQIFNDMTILYVEDDENIREQLTTILKRRFKTVLTAEHGEEGLRVFGREKPDLILTDIQMPVMDGLEMTAKIREVDADIPIVVLTAFNESHYLSKAIELQVDRFIHKPLQREELLSALRKAAESRIKQREIDEKDKIIESLICWNPYFSLLLNSTKLPELETHLCDYLGFSSHMEFRDKEAEMVKANIEDAYIPLGDEDFPHYDITTYLSSLSDRNHAFWLWSCKENQMHRFWLKTAYHAATDLYLVTLLENDKEGEEGGGLC